MDYSNRTTTREKASAWVVVMPLAEAMFVEFKEFSKKKPEAPVSKGKIRNVNRLIDQCRKVLADEPSIELLNSLDEDEVPQNSDVVLELSQYVAALKQFRSTYYRWNGVKHGWVVEDGVVEDSDGDDD